ncbi:MAG: hypothetical protein ACRDI3_06420 [Actinomycetota bacterium]
MKRTLVLMLVMTLCVGTFASAEAKKKKKPKRVERTVEGSYDAPPLVIAGTCAQSGAIGCVSIATGPGELYITKAKITDSHGQPVVVSVSANTDGEIGDDVSYGTFCGELEEPIQFDPGVELHLWVGVIEDAVTQACAPGLATSGSITVTLSNLP